MAGLSPDLDAEPGLFQYSQFSGGDPVMKPVHSDPALLLIMSQFQHIVLNTDTDAEPGFFQHSQFSGEDPAMKPDMEPVPSDPALFLIMSQFQYTVLNTDTDFFKTGFYTAFICVSVHGVHGTLYLLINLYG